MKTEYLTNALKIPYGVTCGAGSLCRGDVLGAFLLAGRPKGGMSWQRRKNTDKVLGFLDDRLQMIEGSLTFLAIRIMEHIDDKKMSHDEKRVLQVCFI